MPYEALKTFPADGIEYLPGDAVNTDEWAAISVATLTAGAYIREVPEGWPLADPSERETEEDAGPDATPAAVELAEEEELDLSEVEGTGADGRITVDDVKQALASSASQEESAGDEPDDSEEPDATPAARELAEEKGVDLASVEGTGADGRITVEDVKAAGEEEEG